MSVSFPYDNSIVLESDAAGDLIIRDAIVKSIYQVVEKEPTGNTTLSQSAFIYDVAGNTTKKIVELASTLSQANDSTFSISLNDHDTMKTVLTTTPSSTTIQGVTFSGDALNLGAVPIIMGGFKLCTIDNSFQIIDNVTNTILYKVE
jgi:hypothetical protein